MWIERALQPSKSRESLSRGIYFGANSFLTFRTVLLLQIEILMEVDVLHVQVHYI